MDVPIVSSRSHGRAAAADAAAVAVAKSDTARSSWCCSSDSPMSGKYEEEYNIFVCESQKVAITIQCVLYAVFYAGFAVSGFAVAGQEGDVNASDVGLQDLCRNNTAANCAAYTDIDSQTSTLFLAAFLNTAMYESECAPCEPSTVQAIANVFVLHELLLAGSAVAGIAFRLPCSYLELYSYVGRFSRSAGRPCPQYLFPLPP